MKWWRTFGWLGTITLAACGGDSTNADERDGNDPLSDDPCARNSATAEGSKWTAVLGQARNDTTLAKSADGSLLASTARGIERDGAILRSFDGAGAHRSFANLGVETLNVFKAYVDSSANVFATSQGEDDGTLLSFFDSSGAMKWQHACSLAECGTIESAKIVGDFVFWVSVDTRTDTFGKRSYIQKIDAAGTLSTLATIRPPGINSSQVFANDIDVDDAGHIVVVGEAVHADWFAMKFDANGTRLWSVVTDDKEILISEQGTSVKFGPGGDVWLGTTSDEGKASVIRLSGYDGSTVWSTSFRPLAASTSYSGDPVWDGDGLKALSLDAAGNAYVTGATNLESHFGKDIYVRAFSADGNELWNELFSVGAPADVSDILAISEEEVYLAGTTSSGQFTDQPSCGNTVAFVHKTGK